MKLSQIIPVCSAAIVGALLSFNVAAHALWLEGDNAATKLYFGEYPENLRETSPGRLDSIIDPRVALIDKNGVEKLVEASRESNYFSIPQGASTAGATVLVQALKQSIREPQGEIPSPTYRRFLYARLGKGGSLPLDIQDTGNLLRLTFMGKPVPKAEIVVIAPNGWEKHLRTDEKGEATFTLLEPGLYVVEAKYEMNKPGEFDGKAYAVESHKATLSLYK
ncbi:DUF4198 domain-containing protein [Nitrosovibrio sp. Nv4]|uniref:DUF4198 domain-containing protein n=1 Tax=Nitrosovibrio sp. Nv4 TaxID=1945880 RepID=UPI000BC553E2|nr:DUF4198 domain-containing protein [Nitrosovibrio sp. Nv4]SOD39843.1 protein of unknown function [Nitrosovibrio sp. Nv4]